MEPNVHSSTPLSRHRTLHGHVVEWLGVRIVSGTFGEGQRLPVESELAAQLGVSRGGLREAIKALGAKGLVAARPRVGTIVQPRQQWNLLDPDVIDWRGRTPDDRFIRDLLQLRLIVEPAAARLAAEHAAPADVADLSHAYARMTAGAANLPAAETDFIAADVTFHLTVLRASGNELVAQLARLLEGGLRHSIEITSHLPAAVAHTLPLHKAVMAAVGAGEADQAAEAMRNILAATEQALRDGGRQGT